MSLASKITSALVPASVEDKELEAALVAVETAKALQASLYAKREKVYPDSLKSR